MTLTLLDATSGKRDLIKSHEPGDLITFFDQSTFKLTLTSISKIQHKIVRTQDYTENRLKIT